MTRSTELVGLVYSDLVGLVRGRFVSIAQLEERLERGVGWVPANQALTVFDEIAQPNPYGATGDLRLVPDPASAFRAEIGEGRPPLHFMLCGATTPDGRPWDGCPRALLADVAERFADQAGLELRVAFEHEFYVDSERSPQPAFSLGSERSFEPTASRLMQALNEAGLEPECLVPEVGPHQYEIPIAPSAALRAADRSAALREIVREVVQVGGDRATFSPVSTPGGPTSGVHIHFSLVDADGTNALGQPGGNGELSDIGGAFAAGVLTHAAGLSALTAPSVISFRRLRPGCWSSAVAALGNANRETLLRIPAPATDSPEHVTTALNLEYRGADATASPHLALAGLIVAGLDGICRGLDPPRPLVADPASLPPSELARRAHARMPGDLSEALEALQNDEVLMEALPSLLAETYLAVKNAELHALDGLEDAEIARRYRDVI